MALIRCHECKSEVSTEAKACPKCGATVRKPTSKIMRTASLVLVVIPLGLGFMGMLVGNQYSASKANDEAATATAAAKKERDRRAALTPDQRASEDKTRADANARRVEAAAKQADVDKKQAALVAAKHLKELAPFMCQELAKRSLRDPESAHFNDDAFLEQRKDGQIHTQVGVRAKNGFGGYTISTMDCVFKVAGGQLIPTKVKEITH